ncbi:hypothetical protein F4818DRAFT_395754 [Hypoxylon cercidicola]|nr:hypothetical protein F4818DRAFT_395754 [Hypoxylon cercidicola]
MGWMWSTPPQSKGPGSDSYSNSTSSETNKPAPEPQSVYGDAEIDKFMAELQAGFGNKPAEPAHPPPPPAESSKTTATPSSSSWFSWGSSKPTSTQADPLPTTTSSSHPDPPAYRSQTSSSSDPAITPDRLDPISESLLPTTMSCRAAFDAAYHCNSLGGQWMSVYREGSVRSCSQQWDDFWFCMRTRTYSPPQREEAIRAHYRAREWAKYHAPDRPSSADVWEPRSEKVEPGTAFRQPMGKPDISDEEWRRLEIERRRQVQEMLRSEGGS